MSDLDTALAQLRARRDAYDRYRAYYQGAHDLAFATDKFKNAFGALFRAFSDNLCPVVVDTVADRLTVTGFQLDGQPARPPRVPQLEGPVTPAPRTPADAAWELWQANRMPRRAGEVHQEAGVTGDAYVIVWPDSAGAVRIWPQRADTVVVSYDPELPGARLWAAKVWAREDGYVRANLYYPDRLEKYISQKKTNGVLPRDSRGFVPYRAAGEPGAVLDNPYGAVPVFHFASNAPVGELGRSELADIVPLQDALNKSIMDMLVAMEFTAFPQRWITGLELETDEITGRPLTPFIPGEDRVWVVGDKEIRFGEFPPAGLDNYLHVQDSLRAEIARVSGTPVHYLMLVSGHWPSGEALRIAEVRLTHKIQDRALAFGESWGDAMSFALQLQGIQAAVTPEWADPQPRSELEHAQELELQQGMGVPEPVLWKDLGYTDAEIQQMQAQAAAADAQMAQQMTQAGPPQEQPTMDGMMNGKKPGA